MPQLNQQAKDASGFGDKVKSLFRPVRGEESVGTSDSSLGTLSPDVWKGLAPENELPVRLKTLLVLEKSLEKRRLETNNLEALWRSIEDILRLEDNPSACDQVLNFLCSLTRSQYSQIGLALRACFYKTICDFGPRGHLGPALFNWLRLLTEDGKDASGFEEFLSPLLPVWAADIITEEGQASVFPPEYIEFMQRIVRNNGTYLDDVHVVEVLRLTCQFACNPDTKTGDVILCLQLVDSVLCYAIMPKEALGLVVATLCHLMNSQHLCEHSWRLMKSLFNSHFGYSAVRSLCLLLDQSALEQQQPDTVLRGAVSFLGLGLWGPQRVLSLRHSPSAVLPSFVRALESNSEIVAYEVLLMTRRLVTKYGPDLQLVSWNLVLRILSRILSLQRSGKLLAWDFSAYFHEIITLAEQYHEENNYGGSADELFRIVEYCAKYRPENSILRLLHYRAQAINPLKSNWLQSLAQLTDTYYRRETRRMVRINALNILRSVYDEHRNLFGQEIVRHALMPLLGDLYKEKDQDIQAHAVRLVCDVARSVCTLDDQHAGAKSNTSDLFLELIDIMDKVINLKLESLVLDKDKDGVVQLSDELKGFLENVDITLVGLQAILEEKWRSWPSTHPLRILEVLANHLYLQLNAGLCTELGSEQRESLLITLLRLRADQSSGRLGLATPGDDSVVYSPYIVCFQSSPDAPCDHSSAKVSVYGWSTVAGAITCAIQNERCWPALSTVLEQLGTLLHHRALVMSAPDCIEPLCLALVSNIAQPTRASALVDMTQTLSGTELAEHICPSLSTLVTYKFKLTEQTQRKMVMAIQECVLSERSYNAVVATIHCLLELPLVTRGMSKDLVIRLADMPSGPKIAIPVIELLTTLVRLPHLYDHFELKHFQKVMDVLGPYTNAQRFTTFIVAMAHRMIFRWFLRVPVGGRAVLARYIVSKIVQIDDANQMQSCSDASNDLKAVIESLRVQEAETKAVLMDFLKHFTFTDEPSQPYQNQWFDAIPQTDVLCRHWIVGETIVTVKTAKLWKNVQSELGGTVDHIDNNSQQLVHDLQDVEQSPRRRHQSAIQRRVTQTASIPGAIKSMDDSCISSSPKLSAPKPSVRIRSRPDICNDVEMSQKLCLGVFTQVHIRHAFGHSSRLFRCDQNGPLSELAADQLEFLLGEMTSLERDRSQSVTRNYSDTALMDADRSSCLPDLPPTHDLSRHSSFSVRSAPGRYSQDCGPLSVDVEARELTTPLSSASSYFSVQSERIKSPRAISDSLQPPDPCWAFVQVCQATQIPTEKVRPVDCAKQPAFERSIRMLDLMNASEVNTIGVVYMGARQTTEAQMLNNQYGSARYEAFLDGLGKLTSLSDKSTFIGGLRDGADGMFTYKWNDPITEVVFHIATLMTNKEGDVACNAKKRLIGNDFVSIVYNDSGQEYKLGTISGQFAHVAVVVREADRHTLKIKIHAKDEISRWIALKEVVVSDDIAPLLCRQMAMRADLSVRIWRNQTNDSMQPYLSGAVERYRQIKQIRERFPPSNSNNGTFLDWIQ